MDFKKLLGGVLFSFLFLTACERAQQERVQLKMAMPSKIRSYSKSLKKLSDSSLMHVIINVSGEGIASPIVYGWDACAHDCSQMNPAPEFFALDVPKGNNRLVQVFAAYIDTTTELGDFYYGDASRTLANVEERIEVPLENIATGMNMKGGGRIAGRYLESENVGPTGELYVRYVPTGKPSMIIEKTSVISGWFQAMALESVPFDYVMSSGLLILPQFSFDSGSSHLGDQVLGVTFPDFYERKQVDQNNNITWVSEKGSQTFLGYWGPGASTKSVCFQNDDYTFTKFAQEGSSGSIALNFSSISNSIDDVLVDGGQLCAGGESEFSNTLVVDPTRFDGEGGRSMAGFTGGFRYRTTANGYRLAEVSSTPISGGTQFHVNYGLLPGVIEAGVSTLHLFKYTSENEMHFKDESAPCLAMAQGHIPGIIKVKDQAISNEGTFDIDFATTEVGKTDVFACLGRGAEVLPLGAQISRWYFYTTGGGGGGCGGGMCGGAPDHYTLTKYFESNNWMFSRDVCAPVSVTVLDASNQPASVGAAFTMTVSVAGANWQLHNTPDCSNATPSNSLTLNFSSGMNQQTFFVKPTLSGLTNEAFAATVSGITLPGSSPAYAFSSQLIQSFASLVLRGWGGRPLSPQMMTNTCHEFFIYAVDANGNITTLSSPQTAYVYFDRSDVTAYSDWNCYTEIAKSGGGPTYHILRSMASGDTFSRFFMMPTGVGALPFHPINNSGGAITDDIQLQSPVGSNATMVDIRSNLSASITPGCYPVRVGFLDSWNNFVTAPVAETLNLTNTSSPAPSDVQLWNNAGCSGATVSSQTFAVGDGSKLLYMQVQGTATQVQIVVPGISGYSSGPGLSYTVTNSNAITNIAVGGEHTCAVKQSGALACWGKNNYGQVGDGSTTNRPEPVSVMGSGVVAVSAGLEHTCALLNDATVKCWGLNGDGQLGDGSTTNRSNPTVVSGLSSVMMLSLGDYHSCALINDGTVKCWGRNANGQLGLGNTTSQNAPALVSGLSNVVQIATGDYHTCSRDSSNVMKCWGQNTYYQIGDSTTTQRESPTLVSGLTNPIFIATGVGNSCSIVSANNDLYCWGKNTYGELGSGGSQTSPQNSGTGYASLVVGDDHLCVRTLGGVVHCRGRNDYGQLGDGTLTDSSSFVALSGGGVYSQISGTSGHVCGVTGATTIKCWGYGISGQLGNNASVSSNTPVTVTAW